MIWRKLNERGVGGLKCELWLSAVFTKKVMFEQRWEGGKEVRQEDIWATNIPGREKTKHENSELELCLTRKKVSVVRET